MHGTLGIGTGLVLSMTLGCGTFGGTSTTEAVTYRHLMNIKRVARSAVANWDDLNRPASAAAA